MTVSSTEREIQTDATYNFFLAFWACVAVYFVIFFIYPNVMAFAMKVRERCQRDEVQERLTILEEHNKGISMKSSSNFVATHSKR